MKVLEPKITIFLLSHMKPTLRDSFESLLAQTRTDFHVVVFDSGRWMYSNDDVSKKMRAIYYDYENHPLVEWYTTGEPKDFQKIKCPVSYWTNHMIRNGYVRGEYFCTFYDDDVYYPNFIEKMAGFLDANPEAMAVRCSQDRIRMFPDGHMDMTPALEAKDFISGPHMDCVVDGAQVMIRSQVLKDMNPTNDPNYTWLPEDPDVSSCSHSDGQFFNEMSKVIDKLYYLDEHLLAHRNTVYSTYTPTL